MKLKFAKVEPFFEVISDWLSFYKPFFIENSLTANQLLGLRHCYGYRFLYLLFREFNRRKLQLPVQPSPPNFHWDLVAFCFAEWLICFIFSRFIHLRMKLPERRSLRPKLTLVNQEPFDHAYILLTLFFPLKCNRV